VDTSPDTDADFEVAATFDQEPSQDDVNFAIVECLEGSEREDEIVAQQMQEALEAGQLDRVADMLGLSSIEIGDIDESTTTTTTAAAANSSSSDSDSGSSSSNTMGESNSEENYYDDFEEFEEDSC
jgi:hypothetical protein